MIGVYLAACLVAGLAGGLPAVGYAADGDPPPLPSAGSAGGGTRCVGASPVRLEGVPWAVARMAPQRAWPLSQGVGITVAVVDSGVSATASGLSDAVLPGNDAASGGPADSDCLGRGTALAGLVAARPTTGTGVVGMAPAARVLPIRITDRNGRVTPEALARGIQAAASSAADVILVGTGTTSNTGALRAAVESAVANDIVVVAAVNDANGAAGRQYDVWYPAAYPSVIAVTGVGADGRPTAELPASAGIDLLGPAVGAVSVGPSGDGHYRVGGSAVAAAYVAGAAALVRSYRPALTQAQVRERLELTAEHPPGTTRNASAGAGTIDPYAAVVAVEPERGIRTVPSRREPVAVASPPPADPALRRAGLLAGAIAVVTLGVLATVATVRTRRDHRDGS